MATGKQTLQPGTVLHSGVRQYTIQTVLGSGGFGITYRAESKFKDGNIMHKAYYALKEFYVEELCNRGLGGRVTGKNADSQQSFDNLKAEFRHEAELLRDVCKHQNIVSINEVFEANDTVYYVMECLEGDNLQKLVTKNGAMSIEQAAPIIAAVGSGLKFLHSKHINHFDIKPENIILVENESGSLSPIIIDFGLARYFGSNKRKSSHSGIMACSDGYSPAEQYIGIEAFSPKSDTYSLAATLLFLLTGKRPPKAPELTEETVRGLLPTLSGDIVNAIVNATRTNVSQRCELQSLIRGIGGDEADDGEGESRTRLLGQGVGSREQVIGSREHVAGSRGQAKKGIIGLAAVLAVVAIGYLVFSAVSTTTKTDDVPVEQADTVSVSGAETVDKDTVKVVKEDKKKEETTVTVVTPSSNTLNLGYATYKGEISGGKPDGEGTMTFTRSHTIDGYNFERGDRLVGFFNHGRIYNCTWYGNDGSVKGEGLNQGE